MQVVTGSIAPSSNLVDECPICFHEFGKGFWKYVGYRVVTLHKPKVGGDPKTQFGLNGHDTCMECALKLFQRAVSANQQTKCPLCQLPLETREIVRIGKQVAARLTPTEDTPGAVYIPPTYQTKESATFLKFLWQFQDKEGVEETETVVNTILAYVEHSDPDFFVE